MKVHIQRLSYRLDGEKGTGMRQKFTPEEGRIYQNINGSYYCCIRSSETWSPYNATMQHTKSRWTFRAVDCRIYEDGRIDWAYSIEGHFEREG